MSDQLAYTPAKLAAATAGGKSGQTHRGGQVYRTRKLSDTTAPTKIQEDCRELHLLYERALAFLMPLRCEHVSALTVGVNWGAYRKADGTDVWFAGGTIALADNTANQYVWIDHAAGTLAKGVAWPGDKTTFTPVARADTSGGSVTAESIRDYTGLVRMQTHASSTSPTGTTGTSFTLDSDNAGAGTDQQLRFNRGSDDAEDAALEWDETNDRVNVLEQHTSATLAPLNADEFQVAGTKVIDEDGAVKVAAGVAGDGLVHAAGVLAVNPDGSTLEIDSDQVRVKDGGISTAKLSDTLADKLVQVSIPDASGASPQTVTVQAKDIQGNNLAEVVYVQVGVYDDADAGTEAANATIADGGAGSLVRWVSTNKVGVFKSDASGQVQVQVTQGMAGTVYLVAAATTRSRMMDCADLGTVVIS